MLISIWYKYSELRTRLIIVKLVTIAAIKLDLLLDVRHERYT